MNSILLSAEQALFTIAAFPACPIIIELTRGNFLFFIFNSAKTKTIF